MISRVRRHPSSLLPPAALLLVALLATAMLAVRPAARAEGSTLISPEEAFAYLQGYSLTTATAPNGFKVLALSPHTPVIASLADTDPDYAFAKLQRTGLIVGGEQLLERGEGDNLAIGIMQLVVLDDASKGAAYVASPAHAPNADATTTVQRIDPGIALGDDAVAWHLVPADPTDDSAIEGYELLWHHGPVVIELVTAGGSGNIKLADPQALATAVERRIAAAGMLPVHAPAIAPPVTEQQRLDRGIKLSTIAPSGMQAPQGFDDTGLAYLHPADSVSRTGDLAASLQSVRTLDLRLRHVIASDQSYEASALDDDTQMDVYAFLLADPAAAQLDLDLRQSSDRAITPPVLVGDATTAYRYTLAAEDGSQIEDVDIYWTHGPLVLNLELMEQAGQRSDDEIGALVQQMEQAYQASPIASPPAAPLDAHASSLEPGTVRVDWINGDDKADGFGIYNPDSGRVVGTAGRYATTFSVGGLTPGTTYCLQVYGYDPAGVSSLSDPACAVVLGGTTPALRPASAAPAQQGGSAPQAADPFAGEVARAFALAAGGATPQGEHRAALARIRAQAHSIDATGLRALKAQAEPAQ